MASSMGVQPLYGKGPHPLLWASSRAAREKITVSSIPNRLNYSLTLSPFLGLCQSFNLKKETT
jgi:hypothetical protein